MAASASDKWRKYKSRFSTTLSTGIGTGTSDTLTPATVTGLPTDTAVTLFIDRVDSTGTKTPTKLEAIKGVISGGNLTSYVRAVEGTEQAHTGGAVVEMVWNAADWNDAIDSFLTEHNQDGTHKAATVTTLKATAAEVATGTDDTKIVTPLAATGIDTRTATFTNKTLTDPIIGNKYKFSAYRSAALNSPNGTGAMVAYDAENFDSNNDFDISTNKGRYTVPVNGFYFFCATISHSANIRTIVSLARNGSNVLRGSDLTATNGAHTVQVSGILNLSAGNYVEVEVWTASSTAYYVGSNTCNFHGFLVCRT